MKTTLALFVVILAGVFPALAQGTFNFNNAPTTAITNVFTGMRAGGLTVGAYYSADTNAVAGQNSSMLVLLPTAITNTFSPGLFLGGTRQVPGVTEGSYIAMQIRAWTSGYASYEDAIQGAISGDFEAVFGSSRVFLVGPLGGGPNPIPSITGVDKLNPFLVGVPIPEPSAYALGLFGAAFLYFCKRPRRR